LFIQFRHDDTFSLPDKLSCQIIKIHCIHIKVGLRRKIGIVAFTALSRTWHKCRVKPCRLGCSQITWMGTISPRAAQCLKAAHTGLGEPFDFIPNGVMPVENRSSHIEGEGFDGIQINRHVMPLIRLISHMMRRFFTKS
jgi:hypothetical protein